MNLVILTPFLNKVVSKFGCGDWFSSAAKIKKEDLGMIKLTLSICFLWKTLMKDHLYCNNLSLVLKCKWKKPTKGGKMKILKENEYLLSPLTIFLTNMTITKFGRFWKKYLLISVHKIKFLRSNTLWIWSTKGVKMPRCTKWLLRVSELVILDESSLVPSRELAIPHRITVS